MLENAFTLQEIQSKSGGLETACLPRARLPERAEYDLQISERTSHLTNDPRFANVVPLPQQIEHLLPVRRILSISLSGKAQNMTPTLIILSILTAAFGIGAAQIWFGQREWVARWRGHRVLIFYRHNRIILEIDGVPVLDQARTILRTTQTQTWTHPALGDTEILLSRIVVGSHGEYTRGLQIGDEIVPLVEVPRHWQGARILAGLKTIHAEDREELFGKISHGEIEELGDPRWIAACRILDAVRQSNATTDEVRETTNLLQVELRKSFEARRRLADETISEIGQNSEDFAAIQERLEHNILDALEAVKSLHMAVISIEAHADETAEMQRVRDIIEHLQAEEEVARFVADLTPDEIADHDTEAVVERVEEVQQS
jgi:hypothetical protein